MVLLDRFSLAGSFNIITVVTIRINHIYPMTRVMTPESPEICAMRHVLSDPKVLNFCNKDLFNCFLRGAQERDNL